MNRAELLALAELVEGLGVRNLWNARRVGAYLFFGVCAFCVAVTFQVGIAILFKTRPDEWPLDLDRLLFSTVPLLVFLALRDMTRSPYDIVAAALRARAEEVGDER